MTGTITSERIYDSAGKFLNVKIEYIPAEKFIGGKPHSIRITPELHGQSVNVGTAKYDAGKIMPKSWLILAEELTKDNFTISSSTEIFQKLDDKRYAGNGDGNLIPVRDAHITLELVPGADMDRAFKRVKEAANRVRSMPPHDIANHELLAVSTRTRSAASR